MVILNQMLMEMLGREALVAAAVQGFDLRLPVKRNPLARRLAKPAVKKARLAVLLITNRPAPERPLAHPQQLRRLQLTELRRLKAAKHAHELDHPHTLMGFRPAHHSLLKGKDLPDRSCAT